MKRTRMWFNCISFAPLLAMLSIAAVIDARQRRIPNWLTFSLIATGLGRSLMLSGPGSFSTSLLGLVAGGAIPLAMFAIGALGGGDVKLLAGIGAWLGPKPALAVFCVEAVIGLVVVLIQAAIQGRTRALFRNSAVIAANFVAASEVGLDHAIESGKSCRSVARPLPYAVPVLIATILVLASAFLNH